METLIDILNRSVGAYGDRPLFTHNAGEPSWETMTYAQFGRLVDRARGGLAHLGIERGDTVAITAGNCVEWAITAYATYGLGAAFVPMYPSQSAEEWAYIVKDSGAKVVFVKDEEDEKHLATELSGTIAAPTLIPIHYECPGYRDWHPLFLDLIRFKRREAEAVGPDTLAAIIYTSGTTGKPKGVELTHRNIVSNVEAARQVLAITPEDRTLAFLPWAHAFGHTAELHTMLASGASMFILEDPTKVAAYLGDAKPTILLAVPKVFNKIYTGIIKQIESKPRPIRALFRSALAGNVCSKWLADLLIFRKIRAKLGGRLRFAASGGAALNRTVMDFMAAIGVTVYEGYGLSETSPVVTMNGTGAHRPGTVGKPIPGVRAVIEPREGFDDGEVVVCGPNVMRGYHNLPEETEAVTTQYGGFRTGDLGRLDADGFLTITGRIKEQYKLENGKYVVPTPLEDALKLSPLILGAFVWGDNKPHNVALIAPAEGADTDHIRAEIDRLSVDWKPYERIRSFAFVEDFTQENGLLTPKMSLRRQKVLERYKDVIEKLYQ